ncbi:MAG: FAD-dependent oxidoreductase [Bryobacterales bacterium]|nr:FAD-dependent oxidoreductase [Bryobacterales bacterium]
MAKQEHDTVVIGAGVAGLTATARLALAGTDVVCLEAADRVGGRIFTIHDPLSPHPIELGAEFVHGLPQETWGWIRRAGLLAYEHSGEVVHMDKGCIHESDEGSEDLVGRLAASTQTRDQSFEEYLSHSRAPEGDRASARSFVEGFNAARSEVISTIALGQETRASDEIQGDRSFHLLNGYDSVVHALLRSIPGHNEIVRLNTRVQRVVWRRGSVDVTYARLDGEAVTLRCRRLIVTISLGALQAQTIAFEPEPDGIYEAAAGLRFGQAYRVTLRFREPFWEHIAGLNRIGFVLSSDADFHAWWTTCPVVTPLLTGWAAGSAADRFQSMNGPQIIASASRSLARILGREIPSPEAAYFHNWEHDPLFRGAYSYVAVDGVSARERLGQPVEDTLFFSGEATEAEGHASTVHGAIRAGARTADLVIRARS